ncbi:MAG: S-adenosylmethionine synthetase [Candidatus Magnetoglobus multicellularis str. Araruama]|uniref:Methionine adenosyltransferase n=1 Tax=Candidatus Magnetoglobus multicellularis str. Araruama TaxID=890399 RepID=A0A1V1P062_9BACT|nr:MAG: S-adenosylmethionine synthetase [Candidatus Magnetoglobus multicellularis str. Araruama]
MRYKNRCPVAVESVVISSQHDKNISLEQIRKEITQKVITPIIPEKFCENSPQIYVNPTGRFVIGGPQGDCGLTGRKIIVDTYGGWARHGGGAFSGKDCTKVDRSAAYAARYVAKNVVAAGLAKECEVQLSYAIGIAHPISILVDTFGSANISEVEIQRRIEANFDLTPRGIINNLGLYRPLYKQTATYGHFGRLDLDLPWEKLDKVTALS